MENDGANKTKVKKPNIHEGHRERMRHAAEVDPDMQTFSYYQTLELLLSYVIPRKDTNPIAHKLLDEFGTLYNVFHASKEDLFSVTGMTNTAASFLSSFYAILRKSEASRRIEPKRLTMVKDVVTVLGPLFIGREEERIYCVTLDINDRVKNIALVEDGSVDSVDMSFNKILVLATRFRAKKVIIAHNHPSGNLNPSRQDIQTTRSLFSLLMSANIFLSDHIIFNNDGNYVSFFELGLLDDLAADCLSGDPVDKLQELRLKRADGFYIFEPPMSETEEVPENDDTVAAKKL